MNISFIYYEFFSYNLIVFFNKIIVFYYFINCQNWNYVLDTFLLFLLFFYVNFYLIFDWYKILNHERLLIMYAALSKRILKWVFNSKRWLFDHHLFSTSLSSKNAFKKLNFLSERKPCSGFTKLNIGFHAVEYFKIVNSKFGIKKNADEPPKSLVVELNERTVFSYKSILLICYVITYRFGRGYL